MLHQGGQKKEKVKRRGKLVRSGFPLGGEIDTGLCYKWVGGGGVAIITGP